ncbi:sensor histidine kinase [Actinoplanes sp. NPDC051346]|uniref:sensor histidine kinase n=1 Tax=Actinoplanes sp. NPDC051346 TaxID=3155048 RepID=UPI0034303801
MSVIETHHAREHSRAFRHEALLYAGHREFLDGTVPFIREGLACDEPTLVVVDAVKITALRAALGGDADRVHFADMAHVGRNPARIIPRWRQFVDEHLHADRPVRGIGEPIWAGRGAAELVECQAHETLLNVAFADSHAWSLLCPYDIEALAPDVVDEARRSHPVVVRHGTRRRSRDYLHAHPSPARLDHPLPPAPAHAEPTAFATGTHVLRMLRAHVQRHAEDYGLDRDATDNLMLAVNEVATNSLRHGGGQGTIRLWCEGDAVVCEISDAGQLRGHPLLGRQRPTLDQAGGRGLWLANQLCDLVQIRSTPAGTTVRLHVATGA